MKNVVTRLLPKRHDGADDQATRDRLMVLIGLIMSAYSVIYIMTSVVIGYPIGVMLMSTCLAAILALLAFFRWSGQYRICGNLLLASCLFVAIIGCSLFTGGIRSPVAHWTIIIPVCSVILLGLSADTMAWLTASCAALLLMSLAGATGYVFPQLYDLHYRIAFAAICDLGLITILFFAAAAYHTNRTTLIAGLRTAKQALRQTNQQTQRALDIQRRAVQEQRNFLAMVSHEFRTPLGIISGAASVLSLIRDGDTDTQAETAKLFRAVRRMEGMIAMLTDDDGLEVAASEFRHRPVDLRAVVEAVLAEASPRRPASLSLTEPLVISGDRNLLSVALASLIGNGSRPAAPIAVHLSRQDRMAHIRVIDQGAEVELADIPNAFEKDSAPGTMEHASGLGLGLFLVKRIVERHNGTMAVDRLPEGGAAFSLLLPLDRPA